MLFRLVPAVSMKLRDELNFGFEDLTFGSDFGMAGTFGAALLLGSDFGVLEDILEIDRFDVFSDFGRPVCGTGITDLALFLPDSDLLVTEFSSLLVSILAPVLGKSLVLGVAVSCFVEETRVTTGLVPGNKVDLGLV